MDPVLVRSIPGFRFRRRTLRRRPSGSSAAGADAVHLHVKDDDGLDSLDSARMDAALAAVRRAVPGIPLGVTTGAWALRNPEQRVAAIRAWRTLPDFASVNWIEDGSDEVAAALLERGVAVEAGLWSVEAIEAWLASPSHQRCCRQDPAMDALLIDLQTAQDTDAKRDVLGQMQELVNETAPVVTLGAGRPFIAWGGDVQGVQPSMDGIMLFGEAWLARE